jgi:hypothetical protein
MRDVAVARDVQREEYREHLRSMVAMLSSVQSEAAHGAAAADVDGMTYEELQLLGETIGKVQVLIIFSTTVTAALAGALNSKSGRHR